MTEAATNTEKAIKAISEVAFNPETTKGQCQTNMLKLAKEAEKMHLALLRSAVAMAFTSQLLTEGF